MSVADDIMNEARENSGLTELEITMNIFRRRHPHKRRVNQECRRLVDAGCLERRGKGGPGAPFTYYIPSKL